MKRELVEKYKKRLQSQLELEASKGSDQLFSREYQMFREELLPPQMSLFEKMCNQAGSLLKVKVKPDTAVKMQKALKTCHIQTNPEGVFALSFLLPITVLIVGTIVSLIFNSLFFTAFFVLIGIVAIKLIQQIPAYLANVWRMKTSNQMVLCIFYVVTYMRHTSNLEKAIEFASQHLSAPLSLDLRKVLWDVESGSFGTVKESLESYLQEWREHNREFVESFHLVESSLYESAEERRIAMLDKSLDVILDQTYEKMLHYAQNLKGPITMLHMLGVVLPILGLVILPLVVSFMENIAWYHISTLYNVVLPIVVYVLGRSILSKRPTGYGDTDIAEINPNIRKYRNIVFKVGEKEVFVSPMFVASLVGGLLLLAALSPLIIHVVNPYFDTSLGGFNLLGYKLSEAGVMIGPYGLGASLLSLLFPLSIALWAGLVFRLRSRNVMKIRNEAKKLEDEFASALFQLGNRLGDGLPAEVAFQKVAQVVSDTTAGRFFRTVATNIAKMGMGVKRALFDPKVGAIVQFPSAVIQSSMQVLIESIKKGPRIAAQALLNVSRYIKEIHKVNERLKDLMADVISDMKSQISFLTPVISGVVIGITSMITFILGRLSQNIENLGAEQAGMQIGTLANLFGDGIPTYYFQAVVGVYVVQIIFILTILSNGIENGHDKLQERYLLGKNLVSGTLLYCFVAGLVMLIFNIIAARIVQVTALVT